MRARAASRSRSSTGAGRASPSARCRTPARDMCSISPTTTAISKAFVKEVVLPDCPPPLFALGHSMGAAVLLRAAYQGRRWFDRIVLSGPMIDLHGAAGSRFARSSARVHAADRAWAAPTCRAAAAPRSTRCRSPATISPPIRCAMPAPPRSWRPSPRSASARRRSAGSNAAFRTMSEFADPNFASRLRQPLLLVAAGQDQHRLDAGDRGVRDAPARRLAPGHPRRAPRDADGAGSLSRAVLGGVRRVRAGHAAVLISRR